MNVPSFPSLFLLATQQYDIDEGRCQELTAPLCAGQISLLVDGLFIRGTLMFEGLAWPKKIHSLIHALCHWGLSGCSVVLLLCVCMYVCLFACILTGSFVCLTPPAVSWSRGHMTSWSVLLHHPPHLLPARPHSSFLPPLHHPSPSFLIPSSNPLLCFAALSFWETFKDGGRSWWSCTQMVGICG